MELQPLTSSSRKSESTSGKNILRRMSHVWSDDLASGTDPSDEEPKPLSPGISILNKGKSDKEQRSNQSKKCLLSPPHVTCEITRKESVNQEVIGAGLPLLQRLLILKQKNEQDIMMQNKSKKAELHGMPENVPKVKLKTPKKENTKTVSLKQRLTEVHTRPRKPTTNTKFWSLLKKATVISPKAKLQDLKVDNEVVRDPPPPPLLPSSSSSLQPNSKPAVELPNVGTGGFENKFVVMCQKLDDQYKQGSLIAQNISAHHRLTKKCTENDIIINTEQCDIRIVHRPNALHLQDDTKRRYDSINDLSPEYAGLSFVKKLKILNERQKLAELEEKAFLRSASLDDSDNTKAAVDAAYIGGQLTRSHSDAMALKLVLKDQKSHKPGSGLGGAATTAFECNETAERMRLKDILKKLSSNRFGGDRANHLMNSQTVEGYAARHSKLTRNVTFNQRRTIVESSPDSCGSSLFAFPDGGTAASQCNTPDFVPLDTIPSDDKTNIPESSRIFATANTEQLFTCTSAHATVQYGSNHVDVRQNCYDEILNGVKTIVDKCLVSSKINDFH